MTVVPEKVWLYHIVHIDKLPSIMAEGFLWSDFETRQKAMPGTVVGMQHIKDRRLSKPLSSHPSLNVGACVPFYFCPRSVMLYLLHRGNMEGVTYRGGQQPIVHLAIEMNDLVAWANDNNLRWAFTLSNAGSNYFEDRNDLSQLDEINWDAVKTNRWSGNGVSREIKEAKQAEFLVERCMPWELVKGIGVHSQVIGAEVTRLIAGHQHRPQIGNRPMWYY